jgi:crossover junction endodeoxyribonuclease RuvC
MITIGIDPGCSGAIVVLDGVKVIEWAIMPTLKVGTNTRVNGAELAALLRNFVDSHACLELVGAMPGNGTASMFSFGHAAGVVAGVLAALSIPVTMVTPQSWKKRAGIQSGADKDVARSRAIQLWPEWRSLDAKGKGQALADAALIARFGAAE